MYKTFMKKELKKEAESVDFFREKWRGISYPVGEFDFILQFSLHPPLFPFQNFLPFSN